MATTAAKTKKAPRSSAPPLPELRQNTDPESPYYGCVAVAGTGPTEGRWLVGNPASGGHWGDESEVAGWARCTP